MAVDFALSSNIANFLFSELNKEEESTRVDFNTKEF
jgi:hypothetical protein